MATVFVERDGGSNVIAVFIHDQGGLEAIDSFDAEVTDFLNASVLQTQTDLAKKHFDSPGRQALIKVLASQFAISDLQMQNDLEAEL